MSIETWKEKGHPPQTALQLEILPEVIVTAFDFIAQITLINGCINHYKFTSTPCVRLRSANRTYTGFNC